LIPHDSQMVSAMGIEFTPTLCHPTKPQRQPGQILCLMNNPFNKGDKVSIKIKGQAVEAWVKQTWNQEVQVRTGDNKLIWRVAKTITLVEAALADEKPTEDAPQPTAAPTSDTSPPPQPAVSTEPAKPNLTTKKGPQKKKQATASVRYKRTRSSGNRRRKI
jgi:hypothetical protein